MPSRWPNSLNAMEALPLEVLWHLLGYLSPLAISRVSASSKLLYARALPHLYHNLKIDCQCRAGHRNNLHVLKVMRKKPQLMSLIRTIDIIDHEYGSWTATQLSLLDIGLSSVIQYPSNIVSFSTEVQWAPHDILFPNLIHLTYLGIRTSEEVEWVRWHLQNCPRLAEMRLSFAFHRARIDSALFDISALSHITKLSLDSISLHGWKGLPTWRLRLIDLRLCTGSEAFLKRMILKNQFSHLQVFRLAGHPAPGFLPKLLLHLLRAPALQELSLRVGKVYQPIDLASYFKSPTQLKTLIMDFRQNITVPETAFKFSPRELQIVLAACPLLEFLGLPIELRNPQYRRYQRLKFPVSLFS